MSPAARDNMPHVFRVLLAMLFLALAAPLAHAQSLAKPLLLVAAPELQGPYSQTALIAIPAGDKHIGFIINRATDLTMGKLFPQHAPSAKVVDPVFFGGPEGSDALFAVVGRNPGHPSMRLFGDLWVTAHAASIDRIIEATPNDARYFVGFVGWRPGELEAEIKKGWWYVNDADPKLLFQKDTSHMWDELVKRGSSVPVLRKGQQSAELEAGKEG